MVQEKNVWRKVNLVDDWNDLHISCRSQLWPMFEMLRFKKLKMTHEEWLSLVKKTEQSIINSPRQFLTTSAKNNILELVVVQAFEEFVNEINQAK